MIKSRAVQKLITIYMGFEEFKSKRGKFTPQVTINKGGGFGLNSGMHHRYDLSQYKAAKLYFDAENKRVGIRVFKEPEDGSFKLKVRNNEKGVYFGAKSFVEAYNLDRSKIAGRYHPELINDPQFGEMFVIYLEKKNL